jgi:hypothetical protein
MTRSEFLKTSMMMGVCAGAVNLAEASLPQKDAVKKKPAPPRNRRPPTITSPLAGGRIPVIVSASSR